MRRLLPALLAVAFAACSGEIVSPFQQTPEPTSPGPGGTGSGSGGGAEVVVPPAPLPDFEPAALGLRQLLSWQYRNAIEDLLGPAAAAAVQPPSDIQINGLTAIGAGQLSLSSSAVTSYETSAYLAVQAALAVPARKAELIACTPTGAGDDACLSKVITRFGRLAFRRPLTADELAQWLKVGHDAAAAYGAFDRGVEFAVAGLLQSPQFLYRPEVGTADPDHPGWVKLTGLELATRLSFFVSGTLPGDALLTAAANGALDTPEGLAAAAQTLLDSPRSHDALWRFFDEMLQTTELPSLSKDVGTYPDFNAALAASMGQETRLFIDELLSTDADARTLLDADFTFVDAKLAALYGVSAPASGFAKVALRTDQPRVGLLGQGAFLAMMAHPVHTSPTLRGKFVRERLLCETVAAPPPNVNTSLPEPPAGAPAQTMREKVSAHMSQPSCKSCHALMDPIGLGFENFDAEGRFRDTEAGRPVDATGTLDGKAFTDARALAGLLKNDERVSRCLARTLYRQASGHVELAGEARPLAAIDGQFKDSGYGLKALMLAIVRSDAFRSGKVPAGVAP